MAIVLWAKPDDPVTVIGTEANSLTNAGLALSSGSFVNTNGRVYADVEFVAGASFSPVTGGYIDFWFLRSIDGGVNFEDGNSTVAPTRPSDTAILVRGGTAIRPQSGASGVPLPPGFYKVLIRNMTGAAFPASGNLIRIASYSESV